MTESISIQQFIRAIRALPEDEQRDNPRVWYLTQKEHWLGWLGQYGGPGAYGRKGGKNRDAKFAYNHIVNCYMLVYLITAANIRPDQHEAVIEASNQDLTLQGRSGAIRRLVPWSEVSAVLWPNGTPKHWWQRG